MREGECEGEDRGGEGKGGGREGGGGREKEKSGGKEGARGRALGTRENEGGRDSAREAIVGFTRPSPPGLKKNISKYFLFIP